MRVMTGHSPYTHRQHHKGNAKDACFADMYSHMSSHKHREPGAKGCGCQAPVIILELRGFHSCCGTQIKLDKELLMNRQPNAESKGNEELTDQQILSLQRDYDIENLTPEMRNSLLCDLTDMGVLSAADLSSDDQSKVDDVLEKIKAFKLLKWSDLTLVDFSNEPEAIMCDYSDPEFRGMSDDEKFAAIMKKYDGGTHITSFKEVTMALHRNRLLTLEQSEVLWQLAMDDYVEKREKISPSAMPGHLTMEQVMFNYRVNVGDFIEQAHSLNPTWVQMERLSQLFEASSK